MLRKASLILALMYISVAKAFVVQPSTRATLSLNDKNQDDLVALDSREYLQGMLERREENPERVTGDKLLGPTLKLAGGVSLALVALVVAFLASNGIV